MIRSVPRARVKQCFTGLSGVTYASRTANLNGGSPNSSEKKDRPPVRAENSFRQDNSDPEIWKVSAFVTK